MYVLVFTLIIAGLIEREKKKMIEKVKIYKLKI